jgi:signal transduction histidine kinase/CheY-like chemotaxis protein
VFNIPFSGSVQELLSRAGGRIELLVRYSPAQGYELIDWNYAAAELFDIGGIRPNRTSLTWDELPTALASYLSQALQVATGASQEAMPEFTHPTKPKKNYFAKLFYQSIPATPEQEEEHWYFFCFQDSVNSLDGSQGAVNQKKLETIGELASGVAHDFNNLIMGIQSNAEAMLVQSNMPPQERNSLVNIIRACSTGASLTRSLLGYAKRQPLTMTSFNLIDLIHDVARIAGVASGSHRILLGKDLEAKSASLMVIGSYSSLSHCLLNLIKNAREAMPDGGTIHINWEGTETMANVTVQDYGAGVSEEDMEHIFEPFFSTKKQGTGLGLAMVQGILNQHLGKVEIRSTVGMGTSVSMIWPRGDMTAAHAKNKDNRDARRSTQRILRQSQRIIMQAQRSPAETHFLIYVIDDDDLVREGLCSLLEHLGHRTQSFGNPDLALQTLLATETPPEVVIVDYNMPEMNGAQFIGRYSTAVAGDARHAEIQIILMSGLPPSYFEDFMSEFGQLKLSLMEKPFTLDTLRKKLHEIQGHRPPVGLPQIGPKVVPRPNSHQLLSPVIESKSAG